MNTFKQIKEYLQTQPELYIAGLTERPTDNIKKFMEKLFAEYFPERRTLYLNHKDQTQAGKRRSFGDIYRVMKHYFPKITITTIYDTLYQLVSENKVVSAFCQVTKTRVYRGTKDGEKGWVNSTLTDEFGTDLTPYIQKYKCVTQSSAGWGTDYGTSKIEFIQL